MKCSACGNENPTNTSFCASCGTKLTAAVTTYAPQIPHEYKPLGPWSYVLWSWLFAIPVVGFLMQIILSFCASNKNLRNYARSYLCMLLIALIFSVIVIVLYFILVAVLGVSFAALLENMGAY